MSNQHLATLRGFEEFHIVVGEIKKHRPVIPVYNAADDNTEDWKAKSNMLKGFNLCLTLLGEDTDE